MKFFNSLSNSSIIHPSVSRLNLNSISKIISIVYLSTVVILQPALASQVTAVVRSGTPVPLRLMTTISSKDSQEGQAIPFEVVNNVMDGGKVIIRAGAPAYGTISKIEKNGIAGKQGSLGIMMQNTRGVDGTTVPLRANLSSEGEGKRGTAISLTAIGTFVIFWPLAFMFLKHGKDAKIPVGTVINSYVSDDVTIALEDTDKSLVDSKTINQNQKSYIEELEGLKELEKKGVITQQEFEAKKQKILTGN